MVYWACFLDLEILFLMNKYVNLDLIDVKIIFDAVVKGNEELDLCFGELENSVVVSIAI